MKKYTIEDLKQFALSKNGLCLSEIYINAHTKYKWQDELGNIFEAKWYSVLAGRWSKQTGNLRKAKKLRKITLEDVQKYAESKGGKCLSTEYINPKTKMLFENSEGKQFYRAWGNLKNGDWDTEQKSQRLSKTKIQKEYLKMLEIIRKDNWKFLDNKYLGINAKHNWQAPDGKIYNTSWSYIKWGGYPSRYSKIQLEVEDFIKSFGLEVIRNDRKLIYPLELDMYIPSLKIAIELNGLYYHTHDRLQNKNKHLQKLQACIEKGIQLVQIWDVVWRDRNTQIKSFLQSKLQANKRRIYARKCKIKEVDYLTTKEFLNTYHILGGNIRFLKSYGLYYQEELLSLITIGKHHRNNNEIVLSRFITKTDTNIIGGLSKLSCHAKSIHGKLHTWIDKLYSTGDNWINSGWKLIDKTYPDYAYYDLKNKKIVSKQSMKKKPGQIISENEMAESKGLLKFYDCGKIKLYF